MTPLARLAWYLLELAFLLAAGFGTGLAVRQLVIR